MKLFQPRKLFQWRRKKSTPAAAVEPTVDSLSSVTLLHDEDSELYFDCLNADFKEDAKDPRFTLTPWERESVLCLQQACEEKQIHYNSLFELAKYVLIARSCCHDDDPHANQKRLENSLNRLRKRQAFEAKYNLKEIDLNEALKEVAAAMPDFFVNDYTKDTEGRIVAAHGPTESKWIYQSKKHHAYLMKVELYRCDLAAANLEEARNGIAIAVRGADTFSFKSHLAYMRMFFRNQELALPCHSHRIKKIYVQTSSGSAKHVNMVKRVLPTKISQRIVVVSKVKELAEWMDTVPCGTQKTVHEWVTERQRVYDTTIQQLHL